MSKACLLLANGFEEIEAVTIIDVLRRAEIETHALSLSDLDVEGAHGITIRADATLDNEASLEWDAVILPGGKLGAANLRDDERVLDLVRRQADSGRIVAAICAAPIALAHAGVLKDRRATSYPSFREQTAPVGTYETSAVVKDKNVITSRGPGTAFAFAFELVAVLRGSDAANRLRGAMLVQAAAS